MTVTLAGGRACGTEGAICTADDKVLSNTETATVQGPPALNVADARVEEGAAATLDFVVTLSRVAAGPVTVAYATTGRQRDGGRGLHDGIGHAHVRPPAQRNRGCRCRCLTTWSMMVGRR